MADIAQEMRYKIDVKNGLVKQPMTGVLMRGDNNANRIIAELVDGDKTVSLDGVTVTGKFFRGGDGIEIPLEGEANGNEATVLLDEHCYAVDGYFEASIKLTTGGATRTILTITGQVVSDGDGGILDIENVVPSVADIVAQYQRMQEVTQQTESAGNAAAASAQTAIASAGKANTAATNANNAASAANTAASGASGWANATMTATALASGSAPTATVTTASDGHKVITLGIPRGNTGATPQISVEVQTGAAGSEASVSVTGTAENPVIHLTIPKGDTGNIGALTINGKNPDASGTVTLGISDISGLSEAIASAGSVKTVAGVSPDSSGNVALKAANVGALSASGTASDSSKLGGKAPEAYAQTEDVLTYEEIQASTDLTGKLPSAKALADGLLYCGAKLLWGYSSSSPQFKEGTLNVPGLSGGRLFAFFTNSGSVCVGSRYNGIGGYLKYNSTSDIVTIAYRYSGSGDNIIIDDNNKGCYGSDGTQWAINQIYRLI